jgi:hypothetical protein
MDARGANLAGTFKLDVVNSAMEPRDGGLSPGGANSIGWLYKVLSLPHGDTSGVG